MRTARWILLGLLAAVVAVTLFLQRETAANLRDELALLQDEQRELAALRAEHKRLKEAQPSAAELERLRADRAALMQVRSDIEQMTNRAAQTERNAAAGLKHAAPALAIGVGRDGALSFDGKLFDASALERRLSELPRGSAVDIQFILDPRTTADDAKAAVDQLVALEKKFGLRMNFRFERRGPASQ